MKILLVLFSVLFLASLAYGDSHLYGQSDRYDRYSSESTDRSDSESRRSLGTITANELNMDSIYNEQNVMDGPYAIDSLSNVYSIRDGSSPYEIDGYANELSLGGGIEIFE